MRNQKVAFTVQWLKGVKCPAGKDRAEYFDHDRSAPAGFGIRVTKAGKKSFFYLYRDEDGRQHRWTIGAFPDEVTLADARIEAKKAAANKTNPANAKQEARKALTFAQLAEKHFFEYGCTKLSLVTLKEYLRLYEKDLKPEFGKRRAQSITRTEVKKFLAKKRQKRYEGNRLVGGGHISNRCFEVIRRIYSWALGEDDLGIETSPCLGIRKEHLAKEPQRERVLTATELKILIGVLKIEPDYSRDFFLFVLLTAARKSEILDLTRQEVDLDERMWNKPGGRRGRKSERTAKLPLSLGAMEILKRRAPGKPHERVFPGPGAAGRHKPNTRFDPKTPLKRLNKKCGFQENFTIHDLRRTVATGLAKLGADEKILDYVLGHESESLRTVYDRHRPIDEVREYLERWRESLEPMILTLNAGSD